MFSTTVQVSLADTLFARLRQASTSVLLLDYDGTIAPFVVKRARAFPYPGIPGLVEAIVATARTRVIFVSGRPAYEIPALCQVTPCPEVWGCHGHERLVEGRTVAAAVMQTEVRAALAGVIESLLQHGLEDALEVKSGSVAVHLRGLPARERDAALAIAQPLLAAAAIPGYLAVHEFDGGIELRVGSANKGDVVRTVLAEVEADVPVAYLGDDLTDEDAFVALNGRGLAVLVRPEPRPSAAQIWIRPPAELIQFLTNWLRAAGGER